MASGLYNRLKYNLMKKLVDLSGDTFKVILLSNLHVFNPDNNVLTDINSNELAAAGNYVNGGAALGSPTVTQDDVNDCATFDALDVVWASASFTAYQAAIYDSTVSNNLVASIDFGGAKTVAAGTFTINWSANGIIRLS